MSTLYLYLGIFIIAKETCGQDEHFIDPGARFVEFEGWGTSLAWFGDVLGGMPQEIQDEITSAIFSPEKLNLNIIRYAIGGTTPGYYPCGPFRAGAATESFRDSLTLPIDSDFVPTYGVKETFFSSIGSRDPRQRKILLAARDLGVDTFEAFSNSPPEWMTISGCSKGNVNGGPLHSNLDPSNVDLFTDYLTEVVRHYHDTYSIVFKYLAPFNEPSSALWDGNSSSQEGCGLEKEVVVAVLRSLHATLLRKNMTYVSISGADETNIDDEYIMQKYFEEQGVTGLLKKVSTHGYKGSKRDLLYSTTQKNGHILWMNEMGWTAVGPQDMTQGLELANRIVLDMRNLLPSAWMYWQVMENKDVWDGFPPWGLLDIPYGDPSLANLRYNSGYYAMMQFSKYIRKGFTFIHINDGNALAAYDRKSKTLVFVIVNSGGNVASRTYSLKMFESFSTITATRTSSREQHIAIAPPTIDGEKLLSYNAPPASVTTIRIEDVTEVNYSNTNLIVNNDFENINSNAWTLYFGDTGGANSDYTRRGRYSGFIRTQSTDLSLNQDVTAPETRTYHLTAWCASSGSSAKLGVKVNDVQGPECSVNSHHGYEVYGISFRANQGDKISVYLYAQRDGSKSFIDDVILH